jgi:hypothetical protein
MLEMLAVPALAFALGIYLPMSINMAILAGGFAAWLLSRRGRDDREKGARKNQGILVASGLVAGAAIAGVVSALIRTLDKETLDNAIDHTVNLSTKAVTNAAGAVEYVTAEWFEKYGMFIGLVMLIILGIICHNVAARAATRQIEMEDSQKE